MNTSRKKYLLLAGGIIIIGLVSGLLVLRGPSFIWQTTAKIFSSSAQDKKLKEIQNNLTSSLAQNLAGQIIKNPSFLETKEGWQALDQATQNMSPETTFPISEIPQSEIITLQDSSSQVVKTYAQNIHEVLSRHAQIAQEQYDKPDIEMIEEAIDKNNFGKIEKLFKLNQDIVADLKKIPVPILWQDIHKEQIGLFMLYGNILQAVQNTAQDPLKTLIALERFEQLPDLMEAMTNKMADLMESG